MRTYSIFCDESGTFTNSDTHVICPIMLVNKSPESIAKFQKVWDKISPAIPYYRFHAVRLAKTQIGKERFSQLLEGIFSRILNMKDVSAFYVIHRSRTFYGFDFHLGMVLHLVEWRVDRILEAAIVEMANSTGIRERILIQVYLAARTPFNTRFLERHLQNSLRRKVRCFVRQRNLGPDQISFNIQFFEYPIAENPCLVISDALSYAVRAFCIRREAVSVSVAKKIAALEALRIDAAQLNNMEIRSLMTCLRSAREAETKIEAECMEETVVDAIAQNRRFKQAAFDPTINALMIQPKWYRLANFDKLFESTFAKIRHKRDYEAGGQLVEAMYRLLERERTLDDDVIPESVLDIREVRVADLHLTVSNHKGFSLIDDPRIIRARELCGKIQYDPSNWGTICSFESHIAVSLQNILYFQRAIDNLEPRVTLLNQQNQNPFIGGGIRAREIGALFGTHAQNIAFNTHCRFFKEGDAVLSNLDDAVLYSMMAEENFETESDRAQQVIYRAHMKMQKYILTGVNEALVEAADELGVVSGKDRAAIQFIEIFPDKAAVIPAYRLAAVMKLAYLQRQPPAWLDRIVDLLFKHEKVVPPLHPLEQVIPYAAMLCKDREICRQLTGLVAGMPYPENIVRTITRVFLLQVAYDSGEGLSARDIDATNAAVPKEILPQWQSYGLDMALARYKNPCAIERWHIGPIEVLPFNYS